MSTALKWAGIVLGAIVLGSLIDSPFAWLALLIFGAWWEINSRIEASRKQIVGILERLAERDR